MIDNELFDIGEDDLRGAVEDLKWEGWRKSIISSCEASEKYLKSALRTVPHEAKTITTHSLTWLYSIISAKRGGNPALERAVKALSKYVVAARYIMPGMVWSREMAVDFIDYAKLIREYVLKICD